MSIVIDRWPTGIKFYLFIGEWLEWFEFAGKCVVEVEHYIWKFLERDIFDRDSFFLRRYCRVDWWGHI
jgi:hypothetical protein